MRDHSGFNSRWNHEVGRHDWYNENEFNSYRPARRYYRTSSGYNPHHHHERPQQRLPEHHEDTRHARDHFNRFSDRDNRYVMKYDSGRGRYAASRSEGYADSSRSSDRDWDNGRNSYWRERYHHQGHEQYDRSFFDRLGDRIRDSWNDWRSGDPDHDRYSHRRGYSSNFRDHDWHIDDDYYRH